MGFFVGRKTYLSDSWNYLDFFIVLIGLLDFMPSGTGSNLSALRSLRVMRPLRAITKFPQLRFLVVLLLQCIPMLSNVIGLCCFIFFVFGILGVQLFQGALHGTCFNHELGENLPMLCSVSGGASLCPKDYECLLLAQNPNRGVIHFDSIGGAIVTIFQVMTIEGWTDIMYMLQDSASEYVFVYFVLLIFVGPIFAIQLFLVVISNKFAQTKESLKDLEAAKVAETQLDSNNKEEGSENAKDHNLHSKSSADENHGKPGRPSNKVMDSNGTEPDGSSRAAMLHSTGQNGMLHATRQNGSQSQMYPPAQRLASANSDTAHKNLNSVTSVATSHSGNGNSDVVTGEGSTEHGLTMYEHGQTASGKIRKTPHARQLGQSGAKKTQKKKGNVGGWRGFLFKVKALAYSEFLANSILAVIVINFIFMAIDHHCDLCQQEYCAKFKATLEISNVFFAIIFLMEMLIKVRAVLCTCIYVHVCICKDHACV